MEHIALILTASAGLIGAAFARLLADEFKAWAPSLISYILRIAIRTLPPASRERCAEEWESHINDLPGDLSKITAACGKLVAAWRIAAEAFGLSKRAFDLVLVVPALLILLPLMALTALAIRLDSPGPVIFRQTRRGLNGRQFAILKFRTMTVQENGQTDAQASEDNPRVTAIGRLLRAVNFDEVPQLLNVLKGDMSLIGPRPHALAHDDYFETILSDYPFRHQVKPGITGWAQCNGARRATPSERVKLDLWYINNWSFWLDIRILIRTVYEVLRKRNGY
jgi:exopolysaccharide biosynthesis polyprenyl glycosylphosphotransferase